MSDNQDYPIGYKKPPKKTQFQKGQSGNPKGRPKHSKNVKTLIREEMEASILIQENGHAKEMSKIQAIVKGLFAGALKQDPKAIRALLPILLQMEPDETSDSAQILEEADQEILKRFMGASQKDDET